MALHRQAFKRLKLRLGLESVSGLSQHALLVDVATKALSRCVRALLLLSHNLASLIQDWASMMGRSLIRHVQGRQQPRRNSKHKPHPSQAYKRAA